MSVFVEVADGDGLGDEVAIGEGERIYGLRRGSKRAIAVSQHKVHIGAAIDIYDVQVAVAVEVASGYSQTVCAGIATRWVCLEGAGRGKTYWIRLSLHAGRQGSERRHNGQQRDGDHAESPRL